MPILCVQGCTHVFNPVTGGPRLVDNKQPMDRDAQLPETQKCPEMSWGCIRGMSARLSRGISGGIVRVNVTYGKNFLGACRCMTVVVL